MCVCGRKCRTFQVSDEKSGVEEDAENKKKKKHTIYIREQMNDVVEIDFNLMGRSKQIPLESNGNIYIYVMKMQLDNGYKMVSVYLHNNDKSDGDEKEYAKVMFQVEMLIADDLMSPIFVPEYLCRKVELEDEYYYKGRPVYARGRGCAATWEKKAEEINATAIKSSFIPDYEIPSVSAQIDDMPEHAFSMLQMGSPKKKSEVIQNLRTLTEMYGSWITKQIIKCPYCGKEITRDEYDINEKGKYVKIHCADKNCMFSLKTGRTIPVYLVDEEIYAKCPTVIISTVDKFARLPWSERVGLLFGRTDRYCSRCGHIAIGEKHAGRHNADVAAGLERAETVACKPFYPPELIIQDELHLITGPLGTIYGGYETVVEEMCCIEKNGKKIRPKYIVSTATIRNAGEQIKFLYGRNEFAQFPPSGFDTRDSFFIKEVPLPTENLVDASEEKISRMISDGKKPFRQYAGICASGQSVKTTLIRLYSIILQTALDIAKNPEYEDYIDPYYTLIGYFNSIRELGGAVRLLDDDIASRIRVVKNKYNSSEQRYLSFEGKKEITSRIPSWEIAQVLEKLAISYDKNKEKQGCYDVVIATNMIAVGMDVDRLGLMSVVGQPKQNFEIYNSM